MATRIGGPIPDSYGLSLTVKVPTATAANPVETGTPLSWSATAAYAAIPTANGNVPDMVAKHPVSDGFTPLGVHVYGASRIAIFPYTGAAPALGGSIVANGTGGVITAGTGNGTRVLFVDTARKIVEVLMP